MLGQHAADRLDAEHLFVIVDVVDDCGYWRSSSAAKKTDADFRISLARLSSLFSARSLRISAAMSVVTPPRRPESTCSRRTHDMQRLRRADPELRTRPTRSSPTPSRAHDGDSATIRTARSRNSGGYLLDVADDIDPILLKGSSLRTRRQDSALSQRLRDHLRRPIPGRRRLLMETAENTVSEIDPLSRVQRSTEPKVQARVRARQARRASASRRFSPMWSGRRSAFGRVQRHLASGAGLSNERHLSVSSGRGQRGNRVVDHGAVDDVGKAPFQASHRFFVALSGRAFALVVGAAG